MSETYKFYVQMDGETYGPYSAKAVRDLELLDDILVTEESMNGQWLPASKFDFDDMVRKEEGVPSQPYVPQPPKPAQPVYQPFNPVPNVQVNQDGTVTNSSNWETPYNANDVPAEIKKWNWGAFFFNWLWGVCNGVYWPLALILVNLIPYVGQLLALGACIALGINGSEWAWKGKQWNSVEHFKRVQHNWAMACLWVLGISVILGIVIGIAAS